MSLSRSPYRNKALYSRTETKGATRLRTQSPQSYYRMEISEDINFHPLISFLQHLSPSLTTLKSPKFLSKHPISTSTTQEKMSQDMRYTCGHKAISSTPFSVHLTDVNTSTSPEHNGDNTMLVIPSPCFNCQDTPLTDKHGDKTDRDPTNPYSGEQSGISGSSPTFTLEARVTTKCVWTKTSFDLRFLDCDDFFDVDLDPLPVEAVGLIGPPTVGRDICPASKKTHSASSSSIGVDESPDPDRTARVIPTPDMTLTGKTDEKPYWKTDKPISKTTTRAKSPSFDSLKGGFYGVDIDLVPFRGGGVSKAALAETMLMLGRQLRDMNEPRDRHEGFWTSLESHHVVGSPEHGAALKETMVTALTAGISQLSSSLLRRGSVQD
jgi:hypothetical protein